jgi:hypothetical protein
MRGGALVAVALACGVAALIVAACGETRRAVGEECLRNDDCLSGFCSARTCVGAPVFVGAPSSPPAGTRDDGGGDDAALVEAGKDAPSDAPGSGG